MLCLKELFYTDPLFALQELGFNYYHVGSAEVSLSQ